ncbi:MAG: DMT family transporter [Saprospiraceae bacterium]|nr:DMT family transporter [Saprospiraceae bacterium]
MRQRAFLSLVAAGIIAGTSGILIKYIEMDAKAIAWVRMGLPTILLGGWILYKKQSILRPGYQSMLVASILNAIRLYLYILAFVLTSVANATVLFYSYPIFAAILGYIFLKEKVLTLHKLLIFTSFAGLIIAYSDRSFSIMNDDLVGMTAALLAAVVYALTVIIFKSRVSRFNQIEMIFYQNLAGAIVFLPFFVIGFPLMTNSDFVLSSTYAIVVGLGVFYLFFLGLKYLKAYMASAIMYLEVVSAVVLGYLILGEVITSRMMIGGSMIIISSFLLNQSK